MASPATPILVNGGADSTLKTGTGAVYGFAFRATSASVFNIRRTSASCSARPTSAPPG